MRILFNIYRKIYWILNVDKYTNEYEQLLKETMYLPELNGFNVEAKEALVKAWMYYKLPEYLTTTSKKKAATVLLLHTQSFLDNHVYNPNREYLKVINYKQWSRTLEGKQEMYEILKNLNE